MKYFLSPIAEKTDPKSNGRSKLSQNVKLSLKTIGIQYFSIQKLKELKLT